MLVVGHPVRNHAVMLRLLLVLLVVMVWVVVRVEVLLCLLMRGRL